MDKLLNLNGLENSKLKRKRGKFQKRKSYQKYFKNNKHTKPEKAVQDILRNLGIKFTTQYLVENKYYDIYIPSKNLLIEVDGNYWHGKDVDYSDKNKIQKRSFKNDKYKDGLATKHGYNIVRLWEDEINETNVKKVLGE